MTAPVLPAAEMGCATTLQREFGPREKPAKPAVMTTRQEAERWWRRVRAASYGLALLVVFAGLLIAGAFIKAAFAQSTLPPKPPEVETHELYVALLNHRLNCVQRFDRDELAKALREKHSERLADAAYLTPQAALELYTNPEVGTWTILRTNPRGKSCPAAAGRYESHSTRMVRVQTCGFLVNSCELPKPERKGP